MRITAKQAKRMSLNQPVHLESVDELSLTCLAIHMAAQKGETHIKCGKLASETTEWLALNDFSVWTSLTINQQYLITWHDAQV